MRYLGGFLGGDASFGNVTLTMHERFELASPVTLHTGAAFQLLRRAAMETLARDRVRRSCCMMSF